GFQLGAVAAAVLRVHGAAHADRLACRRSDLAAVPRDHRGGDSGQARGERCGCAPFGHERAAIVAARRVDEHGRADGAVRAEHWLRLRDPVAAHLRNAGDHGVGHHAAHAAAADALRGTDDRAATLDPRRRRVTRAVAPASSTALLAFVDVEDLSALL